MFYFPCPQYARDKGNVTKSPMIYALSFLTYEYVFFLFVFFFYLSGKKKKVSLSNIPRTQISRSDEQVNHKCLEVAGCIPRAEQQCSESGHLTKLLC